MTVFRRLSRTLWVKRLQAALLGMWLAFGVSPEARSDPPSDRRAQVQFYIETYGLSDPEHYPQVSRAYRIFSQISQVADKQGKRLPRLQVINSPGDPWAIALPDGYVVLSRRAVEIAYQGVAEAVGDTRLAFVLGHELAHLAKNDFWHQEVYQALAGDVSASTARLRELLATADGATGSATAGALATLRLKEAEADDLGFLYAGLAGFAVDTLLGRMADDQPDFFQHWLAQTQTDLDRQHPTPAERAHLLRARLRGLQDKLAFFHYGVRLAHFGRYDDAEYFLREFQQVFPGREVFGNLGYLELQRALRMMPTAWAHRYCLWPVLDPNTRAAALNVRGAADGSEDELPPLARAGLEQSVAYSRRAAEADASYLPARLNLAAAYFFLGEIYKARAVIEEARQLAPEDGAVRNLRALILYQEGLESDLWPTAVRILEGSAAESACAAYNLAQVLEERGRGGRAQAVWGTLLDRLEALPPPYRLTVCRRAGDEAACAVAAGREQALPWRLPATLGMDLLDKSARAKAGLDAWARVPFDWGKPGMQGHIYLGPNGDSVLELDGYVEVAVLGRADLGEVSQLLACCGEPSLKRPVAGGEVWAYGPLQAVLVREGRVVEVWGIR